MNTADFIDLYARKLIARMERAPAEYVDTPATAHALAVKMVQKMRTNGVRTVQLGDALKDTCRAVGLKPTYKELEPFVKALSD